MTEYDLRVKLFQTTYDFLSYLSDRELVIVDHKGIGQRRGEVLYIFDPNLMSPDDVAQLYQKISINSFVLTIPPDSPIEGSTYLDVTDMTLKRFDGVNWNTIAIVGTILPYWIEQLPDGTYRIWTKTRIAANSSTVLYIQKKDGYSPDGDSVFEFFDDFDGNSLDTSKWEKINNGITVGNSKITITNDAIGHYLDNIQDKIITVKIINYQSGGWGGYGIYQNFDMNEDVTSEKGFCFRFDSTNTLSVKDWNDGTRDGVWVNQPLPDTLKFEIDNTNVRYYYNDDLLWTKPIPTISGYLKFMANNGNSLQIDYVFIRKYADQEPTVSIEQISDDTWKITITNNNDYDLTDFQVAVEGIPLTSNTESLYVEYAPPKEIKYIYLMNTKTVDESGILYDSIPSGYIIPQKQLVDDSGTVYNYMTENNTIYIEIPTDNPIYAQTLKTLSFNDVDYTPPTLDISIKKWIDMVFSDNSINVGGGDSSQILQHSISMDLDTKFVKSTVVLDDGTTDFAYYDFSSEYDEIQNMVDVSIDTAYENGAVIVSALLTNGKTKTDIWQLTKLDMEKIYATLQSIYSDFEGLWLKIDDLEYLFPIVSRNKQPQLNVAKDMSISGSVVYEVLGAPSNSWSFELYANDYSKIAVLEQLLQNPICYVKIDEIGVYKQCIIDSVSYTRITTGKYSINMDLTIL